MKTFIIGLFAVSFIGATSAHAGLSAAGPVKSNSTSASISGIAGVIHCKDAGNGLYVAGNMKIVEASSNKVLPVVRVTKLNADNMQTLWTKDFGLSQSYNSTWATKMVCKNNKVYVTGGFTEGVAPPLAGPPHSYDTDAFLVRLDGNNGNILSTTKHKPVNPDINPVNKITDMGLHIAVDDQDNAYIAGNTGTLMISSNYAWGYSKWFITKIDSAGVIQWSNLIQGPYIDADPYWARNAPQGIALNSNQSGLIVSGYIAVDDGVTAAHLVKYNTSTGYTDVMAGFYNAHNASQLFTSGLVLDAQDNIYFGGVGGSYEEGKAGIFVTKLDSSLNYQWAHFHASGDFNASESMDQVSLDRNGNILMTGHTLSSTIVTKRLNSANGSPLYSNTIVSPLGGYMKVMSQQVDSQNNAKIMFHGTQTAANNSDVYVAGYTPSGVKFSTLGYNMAPGYYDYAIGSEQMSNNDLILVTASSQWQTMSSGAQINRVKLNPAGPVLPRTPPMSPL